jgi:predicted restriction endonuclease
VNVIKLKLKIKSLEKEINSLSSHNLVYFHQQNKVKEHMSIRGEKGTHFYRTSLYIQPNKTVDYIDICLHGKLLEKEMYDFMVDLCGKSCDGYNQAKERAPYWRIRIDDFHFIRKAAYRYAGFKSPKEYLQHQNHSKSSINKNLLKNVTKSKFITIVNNQLKNSLQGITETEKETLVNSRIGRNVLREGILEIYNNSCAMCAINDSKLLRASHISKWSEDINNRLNPNNVLCLCGLHDLAFENGIIFITDNYEIKINSKSSEVSTLLKNITPRKLKLPSKKEFFPDKNLLKKHRNISSKAL